MPGGVACPTPPGFVFFAVYAFLNHCPGPRNNAMSVTIAEELAVRPTDPRLVPIAERVLAGERLDREDGITLFESNDLLAIGALADLVNRRKNGDRVF